jgi:hypothetical protein
MLQDPEQLADDVNKFQAYLCTSTHTPTEWQDVWHRVSDFLEPPSSRVQLYQGQL